MPIELISYYCLDKLILSLQFVVKSTLTTLNDSLPWLLITLEPNNEPFPTLTETSSPNERERKLPQRFC